MDDYVRADLAARFTYHAPFGDQPIRYEMIRDRARNLAEFIAEKCRASRELAQALTSLEQAVMWANAAIARNETRPEGRGM